MRTWKVLLHLLLTLLLSIGASGVVSAKVASGAQNLVWTGHQAEAVFNWLTCQGKSERSTTGPPGCSVVPKSAGKLPSWCFVAGTKVKTPEGEKNIEDIKSGDLVYAYDQSTNEVVVRKVTDTYHNWTENLVDLSVDGEVITSTPSHKYWVPEVGEWIPAKELSVGTRLLKADGSITVVTAIDFREKLTDVFNFAVEGEHNYFVGEKGYLVHNGAGDGSFADYNQARNAALDWLNQRGFKAEAQTIGKFGDNAGKPIGMQTADGKTGFRVEFDKRSGAHINVWSGKEKGPHIKFEGSQKQVNNIVKRFMCK